MGVWGVGVFDDDLAADVRAEWRDGLAAGRGARRVTRRIVRHYLGVLDPDEDVVFWLGLAAAQSETGRLQRSVRDRALAHLATRDDLGLWVESDRPAREAVLAALERELRGPPRPREDVRAAMQALVEQSPVAVGDALLVRNPANDAERIFVVVALGEGYPAGTTLPVLEQLLWTGGELPGVVEMATGPCLHSVRDLGRRPDRVRPSLLRVLGQDLPDTVRVVARDVPRPPAGDLGDGSIFSGEVTIAGVTWDGVAAGVGTPHALDDEALTRRHLGNH